MGCDIHFYVEKFNIDSGRWETADKWTKNPYNEDGSLTVAYGNNFYSGRNYSLFAILADVRNGRGFAGIRTGDGFVPIAEPRGVPEDACPEYKTASDDYGVDGHSHSYFTINELLAYDWTQTTKHQGWVRLDDWAGWRDKGKPESWSGAISGLNVDHKTPDDFEAAWRLLVAEKVAAKEKGWSENTRPSYIFNRRDAFGDAPRDDPSRLDRDRFAYHVGSSPTNKIVCCVSWTDPYYKSASSFWSETIPRLLALAQGDFDSVRACFFFDN